MSATPDNVELLLNEIRSTILENQKFLQNLEEENDNDELEPENFAAPEEVDDSDEFEEL